MMTSQCAATASEVKTLWHDRNMYIISTMTTTMMMMMMMMMMMLTRQVTARHGGVL